MTGSKILDGNWLLARDPEKIWLGGQEVVVVATATNPMVPDAYSFPLKLDAGPQSVRVGFCRRGLGLHPALPPSRPPVDRRGTAPPADRAILSIEGQHT
jgi:hypothetical protein